MLTAVAAEHPRGALAAAIGASMAGQRATAFLSGPDVLAASDLLAIAAGRQLPLVLHLATRARAAHAPTLGSGHEAYHAACDQGAMLFFATNVQEAVDLTLITRRVAERALVPVIVAMDVEQTATAIQDVRLPDDELIRGYLGAPHATIETPTEAQRLVFGDTRRRVPRLYDLERPLMLSPLQDPESWARGEAGRRPFVTAPVATMLADACVAFADETGRRYDPLLQHRVDDAEIVVVAQGSAVETACCVADLPRSTLRARIGVVGIRCLRPWPGAALARALEGANTVVVLERTDTPLAGDGPLARAVRDALATGRGRHRPRLVDVHAGLGGLPLRAADLLTLIQTVPASSQARFYLGLDFVRTRSVYPKQQALMDALRRSDPALATLGVRSREPPPTCRPPGATTIAVCRRAGEDESVAGEVASLLHELFGGSVRSRPAVTWQRCDQPCADIVIHAPRALRDPGDDVRVDVTLMLLEDPRATPMADRRADDGIMLVVAAPDGRVPRGPRGVPLFAVPASTRPDDRAEALLGATLALVVRRSGLATPPQTRLRAVRAAGLSDRPEAEREERLAAFLTGFQSVAPVDDSASDADVAPADDSVAAPQPTTGERTVHSLARFWDQVGVLYRDGRPELLAADPALGTAVVPPLASTFRVVTRSRRLLPVFDPATCDGHPDLWMSDPDGAVAPLVISARALLEAGIDLASRRGRPADALRAVVAKLATRANTLVATETPTPATARVLFEAAGDDVLAKLDDTRRGPIREALGTVLEEIGPLPIARTRVFFDEPHRRQAGTGELFSLAVDPDACKSPEVVLAACAGRGLRAVVPTPEQLTAARRGWALWRRLPDTTGATIERARVHPDVGTLAAIMLSRHCLHAMAGGDGAEAGSGARLSLARVLALAEFHLQPRMQQHLDAVETLRAKLGERIRETLAEALPTGDLSALAEGLDVLGRADVDLGALSSKIDTAVSGGRVDGARLGRLVDAARGLADLSWRLGRGPEGLGRARVGLVIAPGAVATWAGAFPYNAFQCPAFIDATGETAHVARGLLEGHLRHALAGVRIMRWARLELEDADAAADTLERLDELRIEDLTDEERRLVPPILVVGDDQTLDSGELVALLHGDLPIKVLVLSDAGSGVDDGLAVDVFGRYPGGRQYDLALLGLLSRHAFVVQTSLAHAEHFADGVLGALTHDGPALVVVHAPSPQRHGFAVGALHEQARRAVASRAFPLLRFDPASGGVFGACLDLAGNPDPTMRFSRAAAEAGGTPVEWAATETRFADHFAPLADGDPRPTPIAEYLDLPADEREGRTPFVVRPNETAGARLRVGPALVADADARLRFWRTLQELAGVVTPFTAKVRADLERELAGAHEDELARLRREHAATVADQRRQFQLEATERITARLMSLVERQSGPRENAGSVP
ncbi:MAG: hypothetical protein HKO59_10900, partial [Phycisphaerales bacterium]|nr:hypothetical protein [Phycisphaerales bacterium]